MISFHEVRFPDNIAYGATGGPEFATTVVVTGAGHEQRNVNWAEARGRWDVASGLKKQAQIDELIAFFRTRRDKTSPAPSPLAPLTNFCGSPRREEGSGTWPDARAKGGYRHYDRKHARHWRRATSPPWSGWLKPGASRRRR